MNQTKLRVLFHFVAADSYLSYTTERVNAVAVETDVAQIVSMRINRQL